MDWNIRVQNHQVPQSIDVDEHRHGETGRLATPRAASLFVPRSIVVGKRNQVWVGGVGDR